MSSVFRALAVYLFLLVILRLTGRRTLGEMTNFDFVLLLIIGEASQQALLGEDYTVTNAVLVVLTLLLANVGLSLLKQRSNTLERLMEGTPTVIVADGRPLEDLMRRARVDLGDVLSAARSKHGLERLDQIKYAILETNGGISIVPAQRETLQ